VSNSDRVAAIEALINRVESLQVDLGEINEDVWNTEPLLPECEGAIDAAISGLDRLANYLEDQKKAAIAEEAEKP
jgi:hypothetical protein